ncbi:MAG: hypothetical protein LBT89_12065 [Planctomycetaceae bacterium]|jgi:hypothetical protein|nr:hypothetical protein [Planctomycetaceae bacterium]
MKNILLVLCVAVCLNVSVFPQEKAASFIQADYAAINGAFSVNMVAAGADNPAKEWSYTPKNTTVIGVPFTPAPVQVTFDGAIYTQDSELFFFYREKRKPLFAAQKTFYQGWIPIVQYDWTEEQIQYAVEMFGFALQDEGPNNSVQFVKIKMKNLSPEKKPIHFGAAIRASGVDHRLGKPAFNKESLYQFEGSEFECDDKIVYQFSGQPALFAVKDAPYTAPFSSKNHPISEDTGVGIVSYSPVLPPNGEYEITLKYPRRAVAKSGTAFIEKLRKADYNDYRSACVDFWTKTIEGGGYFAIPEKRVNDSYKAGLVHLILATRTHGNDVKRQGSGLPYDGIFFNDFIDMRLIYDAAGLPEFVEVNFDWLKKSVNKEGLFVDSSVSHNKEIMTSHGQALYSVCNHFIYHDNKQLAQEMLDTVQKAVGLIANDHQKQPNGLVRPSSTFDAEMIQGYYTSHNLWCLLALRSAVLYAEYLDLKDLARQWRTLEHSYRKSVLLAIEQSAAADGYVPTGLYPFKFGKETGWAEYATNQDWENMLLVYPTETLAVNDYKVKGTLTHIRKNKFREGVLTYRNGQHLHQYATTNLTNQHIAINDQITALYDLYHILLHNGSTHEGFENMVDPWGDRDPAPIPGPHAWAAAKTSLLIRNALIREYGGYAGLNGSERSLYLFSVISPCWDKENQKVEIINARTEFGTVNATLTFKEKGAGVSIDARFVRTPKNIFIAVPHFKTLKNVTITPPLPVSLESGYIVCPPETKAVEIEWTDKEQVNHFHTLLENYRKEPGICYRGSELIVIPPLSEGFLFASERSQAAEVLSFDLVKKAFLTEYNRRRVQYQDAGKTLLTPEPPAFR